MTTSLPDSSLADTYVTLLGTLEELNTSILATLDGIHSIRSVLGLPVPRYPANTDDILAACRGLVDLVGEVSAYLADPNHPGESSLYEAVQRARCDTLDWALDAEYQPRAVRMKPAIVRLRFDPNPLFACGDVECCGPAWPQWIITVTHHDGRMNSYSGDTIRDAWKERLQDDSDL
jgi:hypothetical protein